MNGRQSMCMLLWTALATLAFFLLQVSGCTPQAESNGEWRKLNIPADVKVELKGLSSVAVTQEQLVFALWGGQRLAVLPLRGGEMKHRWVNTTAELTAWQNLFGGAIATTNGDDLYVSHSEAVYRVSLEDLNVKKVTDIAVPCGLVRLTCSPSGTLYGLWLPAVVDKLSIWEIGQDGYATRTELEMPAEFASATWVAGILANEQGLYILLLNDYWLWLAKYAPGEERLDYSKRIAPYIGGIVDGMRARVWRIGPDRLLVYCGDKVYEVHEQRMHLQRSTDYVDVVLKDDRLESAFVAYDSHSSSLYVITDDNGYGGDAFVRVLVLGN